MTHLDRLKAASIALFFLVAFVWRTWQQYRRTGDSGLRLQKSTGAQRLVAVAFAAAIALLAVDAALALVRSPWPAVPFAGACRVAGGVLQLAGFVVTIVAQVDLGKSWRIGVRLDEKTEFVRAGLYRRMRNPIFTGIIVYALGYWLWTPAAATAAAGVLLLVAGIHVQVVRVEEPYLAATHGETYAAYLREAGRYLPRW